MFSKDADRTQIESRPSSAGEYAATFSRWEKEFRPTNSTYRSDSSIVAGFFARSFRVVTTSAS